MKKRVLNYRIYFIMEVCFKCYFLFPGELFPQFWSHKLFEFFSKIGLKKFPPKERVRWKLALLHTHNFLFVISCKIQSKGRQISSSQKKRTIEKWTKLRKKNKSSTFWKPWRSNQFFWGLFLGTDVSET